MWLFVWMGKIWCDHCSRVMGYRVVWPQQPCDWLPYYLATADVWWVTVWCGNSRRVMGYRVMWPQHADVWRVTVWCGHSMQTCDGLPCGGHSRRVMGCCVVWSQQLCVMSYDRHVIKWPYGPPSAERSNSSRCTPRSPALYTVRHWHPIINAGCE